MAQHGSQWGLTRAYNDCSSNKPTMWDEIADMPGEIFDVSDETRDEMEEAWQAWDDDAALEEFSLECAFGPEE